MSAFVGRYPQSVVFTDALERVLAAYQLAGTPIDGYSNFDDKVLENPRHLL